MRPRTSTCWRCNAGPGDCEYLAISAHAFVMLCDRCHFADAKARLLRTLADPPRLRTTGLLVGGLARRVDRLLLGAPKIRPFSTRIPWGWRAEVEYGRDSEIIMPIWLYWLRHARLAWWYLRRETVRLGFYQGPEGGLFSEFRWSLYFWRTNYNRYGYRRRWFAFGEWIQRRILDDFNARVPRWE